MTGLNFDRVLSADNWTWLGRVAHDDGTHTHYVIDKRTWTTEVDLGANAHWASCRDLLPR